MPQDAILGTSNLTQDHRGCVITGNEPQIGPRPVGPVTKLQPSPEGLGDGSPRLWSAGGAALPTFGVPHLRRSDDVAESVPALPGWAEVWLPALRAWVRFAVHFRVPTQTLPSLGTQVVLTQTL